MTDTATIAETVYVLLKRDLFECPNHQGYTGIRDKAGTWPASHFSAREIPILTEYDKWKREHYALPLEAAPEFTNACFDDLARDHLIEQRDRLTASLAAEREAREIAERERDEARAKAGKLHDYANMRDVQIVDLVARAEAAEAEIARREQAVVDEREACAKVAEAMPWHQHTSPDHIRATSPQDVAAAIRARSEEVEP